MNFRLLVFSLFLLNSSCSLVPSSSEDIKVYIDVKNPTQFKQNLIESFLLSSTPPTSYSGFNCFGVNIMGPGIKDIDDKEDTASILSNLYSGSSYCSYPGVTSKPLTGTGSNTIELVVPAGKSRIIQYVGITDSGGTVCSSSQSIGENKNDTGASYYEVGRTITDLFTETAVNITNAYDTASNQSNRQLNCNSSSCPTSTLYDNQITNGSYSDYNAVYYLAQSFSPSNAITLSFVAVKLKNTSTSTTMKMELYSDVSGSPGSAISTSDTQNVINSASYMDYSFTFSTNNTISGGSTYWIALSKSTPAGDPALSWEGAVGDPFPSGAAKSYGGSVWTPLTTGFDFYFKIYACE